jgi:carboxypeptidase family protein
MFDRERLRPLHIAAPVGFCREQLLLNGDARSSIASFRICTTVFLGERVGMSGLFAVLVTAALLNDIDDSGVVVDAGGGGGVPGADVVARHNPIGVTTSGVTNSQCGDFTIPGLNVAAYTVTVSLTGCRLSSSNSRL